jgi:outer membrane lipoprotein-sorting protein
MLIRSLIAGGILLSAGGAPTTGDAVIRAMHDRYASSWYHTLSFRQKTTLRTKADTMAIETWDEQAMFPGRLRIDIHRASGLLNLVFSGDSLYVWRGDSVLVRNESRNILLIMGFDVYAQPVDKTLEVLAKEHYPMSPVREDTWEGRPVYVIGGGPGDLKSRQIWVDKERLLFVRAIEPSSSDSTRITDVRFDNYVKFPSGWVSETVEDYTDGKLTQKEEYSDVRVNPSIDPARFTPPAGRPAR